MSVIANTRIVKIRYRAKGLANKTLLYWSDQNLFNFLLYCEIFKVTTFLFVIPRINRIYIVLGGTLLSFFDSGK